MEMVSEASNAQMDLFSLYGLFMTSWSVLDHLVQTAIWKELGVSIEKASCVTAKLQFYPRAQLLRNLLKLHGDKHKQAMAILEKVEGFAQRNTLVHGQIIVGDPSALTFVKSDGGSVVLKKFGVEQLRTHIFNLNSRTDNLQELLGVTHDEMQNFCNYLVHQAGGIPK